MARLRMRCAHPISGGGRRRASSRIAGVAAAIAVLALVLCVAAPAFAGSVNFETAWRNPLPSGNIE